MKNPLDYLAVVERSAVSRGELDTGAWSDAHRTDTGSETFTQQHFAEEVDVNTIVRRFGITRSMPFGVMGGVYGDFSGVTDFESAKAMIVSADERFMKLPADIRERFGNDPSALIAFAQSVPEDEFLRSFEVVPESVKDEVVS